MKTKININGKEVEIELTPDQVAEIKKHSMDVKERIKSFEDALKDQGISEDEFYTSCKGLTLDEIAYKKIKVISKSLNEGWIPDWDNSNQYKYYPYFDMRNGVSFSCSTYHRWFTAAAAGSRLCFKTSELAEYSGKQFLNIYKDFLTIK